MVIDEGVFNGHQIWTECNLFLPLTSNLVFLFYKIWSIFYNPQKGIKRSLKLVISQDGADQLHLVTARIFFKILGDHQAITDHLLLRFYRIWHVVHAQRSNITMCLRQK